MNPTHRPLSRQVESFLREFGQSSGLPFSDVLGTEQVHEVLASVGCFFRERLYTPLVTLWIFLSQVLDPDHSMRQAVARFLAFRVAQGWKPCSAETKAYGMARQRLPEEVLAKMTCVTGEQLMRQAPAPWSWRGRHVKVIDGSTASMPDTPANQAAYPQPRTQPTGLGFPILRFVVLFSLAVGTVLDAAMGPYKGKQTGETALFRGLHERLDKGDVLLADRYFCSYFEIALLQERGVDVVMRLHHRRRVDFRRGRRLAKGDHIVQWHKPKSCPDWLDKESYRALPKTLTMRELRVHVPYKHFRSREVLVVTTLLDDTAFPKQEVGDLYRLRWHAELDLRSLKSVLQMDVLRCKTPAMVRKEIWAHLLAYNLIRKVMAQAAQEHHLDPRTISFKGTLQTLSAFRLPLLTAPAEQVTPICHSLLRAVAQHRVGDRPNRVEPRAKKRRPKPLPLLNRPRADARKALLRGACG
jgi:hypothetical protein